MTKPILRYLLLALVVGTVIVVDQLTKLSIMQNMRLHESIPIIPNLFSLTYIRNPGAAFGLLAGSSNAFRMLFFGITSLFALGLLGTILVRLPARDWAGQLSIAAILGGAIGTYHWPAFNVADSAISVGVVFLIIHFAFEKKEAPRVPSGTASSSAKS